MTTRKIWIGFTIAVFCVALGFNTQADQWDKKTILTVHETMQLPGATLTPGKYVFKLMNSSSNRHIVQVFNEAEDQLITTILAIPNQRLKPTGESEFGFWEMPQGSPPAMRSWFYPGDNFGQEFAYPKSQIAKIATTSSDPVPSISDEEQAKLSDEAKTDTKVEEAGVATTSEPTDKTIASSQPAPQSQTPEPRSEPTPAPSAPTPEPAPAPSASRPEPPTAPVASNQTTTDTTDRTARPVDESRTLPSTASPVPLMGLLGMLSIGTGLVLRAIRRR